MPYYFSTFLSPSFFACTFSYCILSDLASMFYVISLIMQYKDLHDFCLIFNFCDLLFLFLSLISMVFVLLSWYFSSLWFGVSIINSVVGIFEYYFFVWLVERCVVYELLAVFSCRLNVTLYLGLYFVLWWYVTGCRTSYSFELMMCCIWLVIEWSMCLVAVVFHKICYITVVVFCYHLL